MAKTIAITGATRGIGRALALEFMRMGHTVAGCGRNAEAIDELNQQAEGKSRFSVVDVVDRSSVENWAGEVVKGLGAPDFLINNAGVINRSAHFVDVPPEEFDTVIDVNLKGAANVLRVFIPAMSKRGSGIILNLSSGWGRSVSPEVAPYCATKWGIEGFSKALAREVPSGLAVIPFSPNVVNTEMLQSCFGASAAECPDPESWAKETAPWILERTAADNGKSLSAPV